MEKAKLFWGWKARGTKDYYLTSPVFPGKIIVVAEYGGTAGVVIVGTRDVQDATFRCS